MPFCRVFLTSLSNKGVTVWFAAYLITSNAIKIALSHIVSKQRLAVLREFFSELKEYFVNDDSMVSC